MVELSIKSLFIHIQSYSNIYTIPSVKYSIRKFHCPGDGPKEFSVLIYKVFANSGGVWIYNTACHSTEILVSIGHWHSVGECSLVT